MNIRHPLRKLFAGSLLTLSSILPFTAMVPEAQAKSIDTILSGYQLQRTSCKSGSFVVISVKNNQYCAFPTQSYPAGIYRLNPDTFELHSIGGSTGLVGTPPPPPVANPYPSLPVGGPVVPSPSIYDNFNQYNPVSPAHEVHIRGMLAKRGISLASCSQTPVTIFTIGRYTACAYPTPSYPAGRYQVDASLPF
ncbi:MAG: hypothetical protein AAGB01_06000 [Cyanobacteria bacterium P01_F01_bin.42]